jgi:hypothetical protein
MHFWAGHWWFVPVTVATWEAEIRRIVVWGCLGIYFMKPHLQNNYSKMDWRCCSGSRVPTLQVQTLNLNSSIYLFIYLSNDDF